MTQRVSWARRLLAFVVLTRPVFLLGGAQLFALGAALAWQQGRHIDTGTYVVGQALVTSVQLATQYANEHFDQEADRDVGGARTWFSGGSGVLARGVLPANTALVSALVCSALVLGLLAAMAARAPAAIAVGLVALVAGWSYSAPPVRLVGRWAGVLAASVVVAVLVPLTALLVFAARVEPPFVALAAALALLHAAMLLVFEAPDADTDEAADKRTATVRLGRARAARLHGALIAAAYLVIALAVALRALPTTTAAATLAGAPLALWQVVALRRRIVAGGARFRWVTVGAVALFSGTATAAIAATLIGGQ